MATELSSTAAALIADGNDSILDHKNTKVNAASTHFGTILTRVNSGELPETVLDVILGWNPIKPSGNGAEVVAYNGGSSQSHGPRVIGGNTAPAALSAEASPEPAPLDPAVQEQLDQLRNPIVQQFLELHNTSPTHATTLVGWLEDYSDLPATQKRGVGIAMANLLSKDEEVATKVDNDGNIVKISEQDARIKELEDELAGVKSSRDNFERDLKNERDENRPASLAGKLKKSEADRKTAEDNLVPYQSAKQDLDDERDADKDGSLANQLRKAQDEDDPKSLAGQLKEKTDEAERAWNSARDEKDERTRLQGELENSVPKADVAAKLETIEEAIEAARKAGRTKSAPVDQLDKADEALTELSKLVGGNS